MTIDEGVSLSQRPSPASAPLVAVVVAAFLAVAGCGRQPTATDAADQTAAPLADSGAHSTEPVRHDAAAGAPPREPTQPVAQSSLQARLRAANPHYNGRGQLRIENGRLVAASLREAGIADLRPLSGEPVEMLDLILTEVSDLSPLSSMPLVELALAGTPVSDLAPLAGMKTLQTLDLMQTRVADLKPLAGLKLQRLYLDDTAVADLSALEGMPLVELYLNGTRINDLKPLTGMPLVQLNLLGTAIRDIAPLAGAPLEMLWLNNTSVVDLGPLAGAPLVSLTVENTPVTDISVVNELPRLERLHIAGTAVTDLSPLAGKQLTRLIFSPGNIHRGIEVARGMASIREIGPSLEAPPPMPPEQFWSEYDTGRWPRVDQPKARMPAAGPAAP